MIKKTTYVILTLLLCISQTSYSQKEAVSSLEISDTATEWKINGNSGITFSQMALSNWAGGGTNSISISGLLEIDAEKNYENFIWKNQLSMAYGVIRQGGSSALWIKSDDRFNLSMIMGRKLDTNIQASLLYTFRSQFAPGYETRSKDKKISDLLSPGYSIFATGIDFNPNENTTIMLSPLSLKTTFMLDDELANRGAFGVEPAEFDKNGNITKEGENIRNEFGGYFKMNYSKEVIKNVNFSIDATLFSNYLNNPENIDVNLRSVISMKVNKYLSANIAGHLIYDDDIDVPVDNDGDEDVDKTGPRTQLKEVIGVSLSFMF